MKKQLLNLSFFLLALVASNNVLAQITAPISNVAPQAITCLNDDALNVIPGKAYTYTVTVPNIVATTGEFTWFVTQNPAFISGGVLNTASAEDKTGVGTILAGVGTSGGGYLNSPKGTATIELLWKIFDPTKDVFVVIQVKGTDANDCAVNNLKVYKILPKNAFALDIANVDANAATPAALTYGTAHSTCVPGLLSAAYDAATKTVKYDYGENYIYYLVSAAYFSGAYTLNFQISGVAAGEVVKADWTYNSGTISWTPLALSGTAPANLTGSTTVNAKATNGTVGAAGESILVRLLVDHTTSTTIFNEGIVAQPIVMAVDGTTGGTLALPDLHHSGGVGVCGVADGFANDKATHTLKPRPRVDATTPTPFVTGTGL